MLTARTILLVDDQELVRKCLSQVLEKAAWRVSTARSGVDALARLERERFDLVLCDLDLGVGINGLDVLRKMPPVSRGVPFVCLTAHGTIDRCREALKAGAADFIEKPVYPAALIAALDRALGVASPAAPAPLDQPPALTRAGNTHVRRALRLIEREYADLDLSVAAIAKSIDVTPEHLARLFREHLGRTPLDHIHETRISASEKLLANFRLSIYEVAATCGYRTTSEMDGWFRRLRSATPSEWRTRIARGQGSDLPYTNQIPATDSR